MKVLMIASQGGHWIQLNRLLPAFESHELVFVSTNPSYASDVTAGRFFTVADANLDQKRRLILVFCQLFILFHKVRPDVVVTTGAAPGLIGLINGRIFRAKTIWVDSIANSEELSTSGRVARFFSDVWLTQWKELSHERGPSYWGSVL
ncbi:hypothetical protein EYS42_15020 [Aquabacterium lacunae]|uniref:UDP-N-acetylglucosamine--LPS N-acetylglucosamine transferase n=1 Tax=Aquabacterium lacunae TaxID=2528630 RepID=A0A4Q9H0H5_9BURK|nr:hypothetical protein [Aquabacterium lacunae]TBO28315.1 hypothetical protein EYS42_15020 [Aquabacterium lacunae]